MKRVTLLLSLLLPFAVQADIIGKVVGIADGDTITVLDASNRQIKIRLHQIDAPEKKQDFGQASKQSLSSLVFGKQVKIEVADTDKYGRTVGKIWVNGQDANLEQVKRGMAWVYQQYAQEPAYFAAERTAKINRVGLWNQPNPMPPWEFRHGGKPTGSRALSRPANPLAKASTSSRRCGDKRFCKEMTSCEEARYFLNECAVKGLDGDGDGSPCESLCSP